MCGVSCSECFCPWVRCDTLQVVAPAKRSTAGFHVADLARTMLLSFQAESRNELDGISGGICIYESCKLLKINVYWLLR